LAIDVQFDTSEFDQIANAFAQADRAAGQFVNGNMEGLGRRIAFIMRQQIRQHRYKGDLEASIQSQYSVQGFKLEIGPTAKRGNYDAGLLLQRGTRPIPNAPFGPIAMWARFRGLPAGPVWWSIKTRGVKAHPFLEETLERGDTQTAIRNTALRIGINLIGHTFQQFPTKGGKSFTATSADTGFGSEAGL